jgi:hypothetical protein
MARATGGIIAASAFPLVFHSIIITQNLSEISSLTSFAPGPLVFSRALETSVYHHLLYGNRVIG